jgi:3-oxoadipate enol-lactonase
MLVIDGQPRTAAPACKAAAQGHDAPMGAVSTARGKIGFTEGGGGPATPIVFLHGVGSDKSVWRPQLAHFGQRRRAVAFDYPGYGESEFVEGATRDDFAASILAAMDSLGIEQAQVCGLSLGGVIAIAMHAAAPQRCASLIIADSFAVHPDGQAIYDRSIAASEAMTMRELAEARSGALLGSAATGELRREVIETMAAIDPAAYRIGAAAVWLADQRDRASDLSVPTLVVAGDEDGITPPALSEELARLIPDSRLELISACGHLANAEQPAEFNHLVNRFLSDVETPV